MLLDAQPDILALLIEKNYVLFAQKTAFGHKIDYPELEAEPAFAGLNRYDMRFVWAYSCASSPFLEIEDTDKRLQACVHYAYPDKSRKIKLSEFSTRIPENLRRGMTKMEKYSVGARIMEYLALKQARENIISIVARKFDATTTAEEKDDYMGHVKVAGAILEEQRKRIEGLDLGMSEEGDTMFKEAIDILALYHQQTN